MENPDRMAREELEAEVIALREQVGTQKKESEKLLRESDTLNAVNTIFRKRISCSTEAELGAACLDIAEEVTGSKFGFIGELNHGGRFDTIAISNPGWDACNMPGSDATRLILNMEVRGLWGRVIKDGTSLIVNEPPAHPDSVGVPEGHPPLTSFIGAPMKRGDKTVGMIALANKEGGYTENDRFALEKLSVAIYESIHSKRVELAIDRQSREIIEMSTPILRIWEGILVAPIVGTLDSERSAKFMDNFLESITRNEAVYTLLDITAVPAIDTQIAQHLIDSIAAARLLGTTVILTGVRSSIAQTMVQIGIDLTGIRTHTSLAGGFLLALEDMGIRLA